MVKVAKQTEEQIEQQYSANLLAGYLKAREIATTFYGTDPERDVVNDVFDFVVADCMDDDGDVNEKKLQQASAGYKRARDTADELFGKTDHETVGGVFMRCIIIDGRGALDEEETSEAFMDLNLARAWAKDVYGEESPEAVFDAFDRAFSDDDEEDESN